jgi:hypothetical protein
VTGTAAAVLSQLDTANLNARQQAAVQNAQNFMQVDMANLSNQQQTEMFKAQQRVQALFSILSSLSSTLCKHSIKRSVVSRSSRRVA